MILSKLMMNGKVGIRSLVVSPLGGRRTRRQTSGLSRAEEEPHQGVAPRNPVNLRTDVRVTMDGHRRSVGVLTLSNLCVRRSLAQGARHRHYGGCSVSSLNG